MNLLLFVVLAFLVCKKSAASNDAKKYLLPGNLRPIHYDLMINTYIENFDKERIESYKFDGQTAITLVAVQDKVKSIVLNIHDTLNITCAILNVEGSEPIDLGRGVVDRSSQKVAFEMKTPLAKNQKVTLNITHAGFHTKQFSGFNFNYYIDNDEMKYILHTQFEPTYARSTFPCFDEPIYKATFNIAVSISNKMVSLGYRPLANTPEERVEKIKDRQVYHFKKTPLPVSTYLIAVIISDYKSTPVGHFSSSYPATGQIGRKEIRVWGQSIYINQTRTMEAQAFGLALMEIYANDFAIPYEFDKLDQVGVVDFQGAMENWGLIFYSESTLMTSYARQLDMVTLIAHELSHQWFGNLVSCHYWSDIWLKEGFATYFGFFGADKVQIPEVNASLLNLPYLFVIEIQQLRAFQNDLPGMTHPLTIEMYNPSEIVYYFDVIEYDKAGSVIRMWTHILGLDCFNKAVRHYLRENKESITTPEVLFSSFDTFANESVTKLPDKPSKLFKCWQVQEGYPVVHVRINPEMESEFILTQETFLLRETFTQQNSTWEIPISYSTSELLNFHNTKATSWLMKNKSTKIKLEKRVDWIIVNNQQSGYYRVNYESYVWKNLLNVLLNTTTTNIIHELNRAQIIDDVANLARSTAFTYVPYDLFLNLTRYLDFEDSYYPWKAALNNFEYLTKMVSKDKIVYDLFKMHILNITRRTYDRLTTLKSVGSFQDEQLRSDIINWACKMGNENCLESAKTILDDHFNKRIVVPASLMPTMLRSAVRKNDDLWYQLWHMYSTADNVIEKKMFVSGLACTGNQQLLKLFLEKTIDSKLFIGSREWSAIFSEISNENPENVGLFLKFIISNNEKILKLCGGRKELGELLVELSKVLGTDEEISTMKRLLVVIRSSNTPVSFQTTRKVLEIMEANREWMNKRLGEIRKWLTSYYS